MTGGTRQASAAGPGMPGTPTRGRSRPCLRGAGKEERPHPEGPVTRCRPNRTRPTAPPSSLRSLPPSRGPLFPSPHTHQRLHLSLPLPQLLPAPPQPPPPPPPRC
uniref:protein TRACHEARY ELEMENT DIFFERENTIATION-RELATED 7A-like n=1 Tax=Ictidomys tridecemlineatus TaxID=43179 RepID=UPI001A9E838D|nr:protein TRACHEARY ELEMENT DIFFERENTIATION-RELATED 7A-like [Ictidomys tridecemlineatus]